MSTGTDYHQTENGQRRRVPAEPAPVYRRSVFERAEIRALVADACQGQVTALQNSAGEFGVALVINQLDAVIDELKRQV